MTSHLLALSADDGAHRDSPVVLTEIPHLCVIQT